MYFSKVSLALISLHAFVNAAVIDKVKRNTGLEVALSRGESAAEVIVTVTNTGAEDLNLLTLGTFLDSAPVQKLVIVDESENQVEFTGIQRSVQYSSLAPEYFQLLSAGATYTTTINPAAVHDLSTGNYTFTAEGAMPFAIGSSTELSGLAVSFKSNILSMSISGDESALVPKAIAPMSINERTVLQSGCSTAQRSAITKALSNCAALAKAAATAASSGSSSKFSEYFKTTSSSTRFVVAARLNAVATQCSSISSGGTKYYCTDVYGYCGSNVLAYTIPSTNEIVNCPLYYSDLPALTGTCHAQDQATTTLHEMPHAPATYSPGTADNAYGYSASVALSSSRAVLNADTYALYANAIYVGC